MKKYIVVALFLSGCAQVSPTIEMEDLASKTNKAKVKIEQCVEFDSLPACKEAAELIDNNHWLIDHSASISNRSGMRANEWELSKKSIGRDLKYISDNYFSFRLKAKDYSVKYGHGEWCKLSMDCQSGLSCLEGTCLPESMKSLWMSSKD